MSYSPTVAKILNKRLPARPIDRIRRIWPDIMALKEAGLLYQQIWEELPENYNLSCPYKTFMSACRQIRAHGKQATVSSVNVTNKTAPLTQREDPFEKAKRKMEEDNRGNNILAGKSIRS